MEWISDYSIQLLMSSGVVLLLVIWMLYRLRVKKESSKEATAPSALNWEEIDQIVRDQLQKWTSDPYLDHFSNDETYRRELMRRSMIRQSLRSCHSGDRLQKEYVKDIIVEIIRPFLKPSNDCWKMLVPFDDPIQLSAKDKFDILLYIYFQRYGLEAMHELVQRYGWEQIKDLPGTEGEKEQSYAIDEDDISQAYRQERPVVKHEERIRIIAQRIYERYKGLSVIDELRDMRIEGVSGGVNGLIQAAPLMSTGSSAGSHYGAPRGVAQALKIPRSYDSVWMFYQGKSIRLGFLSFESERELKRVCQTIYKHGAPGPLTEVDGYRVNDMKDGSRVVVMRPPFSESWAFFVRKFEREQPSLSRLITANGAADVIRLLQFLMKGARITAVTGAQGSGKTTLLMALVQSIYAFYPLRVQEQAFELHLRQLYPHRNILTLRETESISGQSGLDVQKKTDGVVHILGEVATDPVAAWMIQMAQVASLFTIFTHHAKTFPDLIGALRNSLLKTGMFHNERIAEQQVVQVIHFNIHLSRNANGMRYVERITECVPSEMTKGIQSYKAQSVREDNNQQDVSIPSPNSWMDYRNAAIQYYDDQINSSSYTYKNIIEFQNGRYVWVNEISDVHVQAMLSQMTDCDQESFREWIASRREYVVA
ncbi:ATPase, T2SS/T4P/T4SS family [Paenibacillus sp. SC116]|uniref:ATPase, T2SS/T4P/T4SS family n=1 Tax=Paenibacillus sp. SC116 TaxID=2968986 RepID=UPI00215B3503|nr:ATPase, T2SS/T4P/T4SS family [Paenibacillus sp. SC116]MCR8842805.1 ATPase, T2SS/T4P/T4SS family [Paenibacillus sp. SC116]